MPGIRIDDPTEPAMFLGCQHHLTEVKDKDAPGGTIQLMEYDMQDQLQSAIVLYKEIVSDCGTLRSAKTPFRSNGSRHLAAQPVTTGPWLRCPWCKGEFEETAFARGTGDPAKHDKRASKKLLDASDVGNHGEKPIPSLGERLVNAPCAC